MKNTVLFLLLIAFFVSCDLIDDKTIITDESTFYVGADLEKIGNSLKIESGNDLLFLRVNSYDAPNVIDEEYTKKFAFLVEDNNGNFFEFKDEGLKDLKFYYHIACYCPPSDDHRLKSGTIQGKKVSDVAWDLDIDVILETGYAFYDDENMIVDTTYAEDAYQFKGEFYLDDF